METLRSQDVQSTKALVQQYLENAESLGTGAEERGHLAQLCSECILLFRIILKSLAANKDTKSKKWRTLGVSLGRSYGRLKIWSDEHGAADGSLDATLAASRDLQRDMLKYVVSISQTLTERLIKLLDVNLGETGLESISAVRSLTAAATEGNSDSSSDSGLSDSSSYTVNEVLEDLRADTTCLLDLEPLLCSPILQTDPEPTATLDSAHLTWRPYHSYCDKVSVRFPMAADDLVNRVGKANYERYLRCQEQKAKNELGDVPSDQTAMGVPDNASSKFHDSGIGSSLHATASTYAETVMSYGMGQGRRVRVPPLPTQAKQGVPFACVACGKWVKIATNSAWKKHVYGDLQPWICLEGDCHLGTDTFPTRNDWINHLALDHGMDPEWRIIQCPLCRVEIGPGKLSVTGHMSDHLEEVSLSALPVDCDFEEDFEGSDYDRDDHEQSSMQDFWCCDLNWPTLNDLLQHDEEVHDAHRNYRQGNSAPNVSGLGIVVADSDHIIPTPAERTNEDQQSDDMRGRAAEGPDYKDELARLQGIADQTTAKSKGKRALKWQSSMTGSDWDALIADISASTNVLVSPEVVRDFTQRAATLDSDTSSRHNQVRDDIGPTADYDQRDPPTLDDRPLTRAWDEDDQGGGSRSRPYQGADSVGLPRRNLGVSELLNGGMRSATTHDQEPKVVKSGPPSSYWSVAEMANFPSLLMCYGTDWQGIASHMTTKTATMVRNFYNRQTGATKPEWVQIALQADRKLQRRENMRLVPPGSGGVQSHSEELVEDDKGQFPGEQNLKAPGVQASASASAPTNEKSTGKPTNDAPKSRGLTHSRGGVLMPKHKSTKRRARREYPSSWGFDKGQMTMKKRVMAVFDRPRQLAKDDMMLSTEHEVRVPLADGKSYVTDLDVETMKRAEGFLNATEEEKGIWISDDPTEEEIKAMLDAQLQ